METGSMAAARASYNQSMSLLAGSFQEPRRLQLQEPLGGELWVPGSKSLAQRVLLAAALGEGPCEVLGLPDGDDVRACLGVIRGLGAGLQRGVRCRIEGLAGRLASPASRIELGESGTLARLTTAIVALHSQRVPLTLLPAGSLRRRHSTALVEALRRAGAVLEGLLEAPGSWPLALKAAGDSRSLELRHPSSSQELSALWLACAARSGASEVRVLGPLPSTPYLDLSEQVLGLFGVELSHERRSPTELLTRLQGPLLNPEQVRIEADASSAAVALGAACLAGGSLSCPGLPATSVQGDVAILEHLRAFGCATRREPNALWAGGLPSRGAQLDLSGEPDLAPVLAVVAAAAAERSGETSELRGLGTLPGKESDRLTVLADGLRAAGWPVELGPDWMRIPAPTGAQADGLILHPMGDHRMAFAFALLGLLRPGLLVQDPGCVAKSWPRFWEDLEALGATR